MAKKPALTLTDESKELLQHMLAALLALAAAGAIEAPEGAAAEPEEDAEEESEEEDAVEEAEAADIAEMDRDELKAVIKEEGLDIKVTKAMDEDAIREAITEARGGGEEAEEEEEAEEDEEAADGPDKEDVRKVLKKLVGADKAAAIKLLKKYKAKTLDDVEEGDYAKLIKEIKKALA